MEKGIVSYHEYQKREHKATQENEHIKFEFDMFLPSDRSYFRIREVAWTPTDVTLVGRPYFNDDFELVIGKPKDSFFPSYDLHILKGHSLEELEIAETVHTGEN